MFRTSKRSRRQPLTPVLATLLLVAGCDPGAYRAPAEAFQAANVDLEGGYFASWELANGARMEREDLADLIVLWSSLAEVPREEYDRTITKMTQRRARDVHDGLRDLREQAFDVLHRYSETLVALADDQPTDRITEGLSGLAEDVQTTLTQAEEIARSAGAATASVETIADFSGPLSGYVALINPLIELIADAARERAIRRTIIRSDRPIRELLGVLEGEAAHALADARRQVAQARVLLGKQMDHASFAELDKHSRAGLVERIARLDALAARIEALDLADTFAAAIAAQAALLEKATLDDVEDWTTTILAFRDRARATLTQVRAVYDGL